jgi:hypothetical protein
MKSLMILTVWSGFCAFLMAGCVYGDPELAVQEMGPTPGANEGCIPQGLTWMNSRLLFSNTWHDTLARVYEIDTAGMSVQRHFDMPGKAVHTSGLEWDGTWLWAVDYKSRKVYQIDAEQSLSLGRCVVVRSIDAPLRGPSACCVAGKGDSMKLLISDFLYSTRVLSMDIPVQGHPFRQAGFHTAFHNNRFSQGLVCCDSVVYESENALFGSILFSRPFSISGGNLEFHKDRVTRWRLPLKGIEDLAFDGRYLWTSDEKTCRFYRIPVPPHSR